MEKAEGHEIQYLDKQDNVPYQKPLQMILVKNCMHNLIHRWFDNQSSASSSIT